MGTQCRRKCSWLNFVRKTNQPRFSLPSKPATVRWAEGSRR